MKEHTASYFAHCLFNASLSSLDDIRRRKSDYRSWHTCLSLTLRVSSPSRRRHTLLPSRDHGPCFMVRYVVALGNPKRKRGTAYD